MGFDTTPDPIFLQGLQNQKWSISGALSELIDNSFGRIRGDADYVHITHNTTQRTLTVMDNGKGMEHVGFLFKLGLTAGRSIDDIGKYGFGGTMAMLWLPDRVEIWTLRDGMVNSDSVDWTEQLASKAYPQISTEWRKATARNTPAELRKAGHGTLIKFHLKKERRFHGSNVRRDLAHNYSPGLRKGKRIVWTTEGKGGQTEDLKPEGVLPTGKGVKRFNIIVQVPDGRELGVRGIVGTVPDLPYKNSNIAVGYGSRVLRETKDCFTSPNGRKRYSGLGITGWLDLGEGWQDLFSTQKDDINDAPAWELLMGHVFQQIEPLLQSAEDEKRNLILDDLRIGIESALNGRGLATFTGGRGKGSSSARKSRRGPSTGEQKARAGVTTIEIIQQGDKEMDGALCSAEVSSANSLSAIVNQDHELVQDAMNKDNRTFLNALVLREVAAAIAPHSSIVRKAFPASIADQLERHDDTQRAQVITRLLVDRARVA